jgi:hypothetical protein
VAAVGLSATFFQDQFGFVAFGGALEPVTTARPRIGRSHVLYCLDLYRDAVSAKAPNRAGAGGNQARARRTGASPAVTMAIESQIRKSAMVPVISDFLFPEAPVLIKELSLLNAVHDVFLLMADARFAYEVPAVSAGWVETFDIETGQTRVLSRREVQRLGERVDAWQEEVMRLARDADLDVVRVGLDRWEMETSLAAFAAERRLRKV